MSSDDPGPFLTFGQLVRWLVYGSPSNDALATIAGHSGIDPVPGLDAFLSAAEEIRRAGENGALMVYGHRPGEKQPRLIPAIDFNAARLDWPNLIAADEGNLIQRGVLRTDEKDSSTWLNLRFKLASARAAFPRLPAFPTAINTPPTSAATDASAVATAANGAPAADDAARTPAPPKRQINSDRNRIIEIKLKQAVAAIKRAIPTRRTDLTSDTMAVMVLGSRDASLSNAGYGFEVIKKMIDGTYPPANRRGFQDPWGPPPT